MTTKEPAQIPKGEQEHNNWPKVAIIVLNWNGWRDTIECLESLRRLTYPNYEIIVVDNGSTDGSVSRIRTAFPDITILETGKNLGYAGGNNRGIDYALEKGADYVMILNNDAKVEPDTLTTMIEVAGESEASVVGALVKDSRNGKVLFARSRYPAMLYYSEPQRAVPNKKWWESDRVDGSAMLLRRDLLLERKEAFGYFLDESLFLYCEEIELGLWCRRAGRKSVIAGNAIVYHKRGASSEKALQFYYLTRNRILLAHKYLRGSTRLIFDLVYPTWRVSRAVMYLGKGKVTVARAIIKGLIDGYRGKIGRTYGP